METSIEGILYLKSQSLSNFDYYWYWLLQLRLKDYWLPIYGLWLLIHHRLRVHHYWLGKILRLNHHLLWHISRLCQWSLFLRGSNTNRLIISILLEAAVEGKNNRENDENDATNNATNNSSNHIGCLLHNFRNAGVQTIVVFLFCITAILRLSVL